MIALIVYMALGLALSGRLLPGYRGAVKCWLGLVFGCVALMWLPCLFAFVWGFTRTAQTAAFALAVVGILALAAEWIIQKRRAVLSWRPEPLNRSDMIGLFLSLFATVLCAWLLHTHVLRPGEDGGLWVGQSTYGDLGMHLGFVESLYQQGFWPPEYSIYPGQTLNYPFLVDAASASLRFFGLSLRMSVILPSLVMLFCVFFGFWLLADKLTKRVGPSLMAWLLFTCNGGFGFVYFFGKYRFSEIFTGFYTTPTNLVDEDIRWVNVICDMLIPQRTTMAGWCVVIAAIFLLITAIEKTLANGGGRREILILAVVGGAMPMIHTHSFLALGILSAVWFFCALPRARKTGRMKALFWNYVLYGAICLALAAPQFFKWTMNSVQTGNMLQWNLGWIAGANGALNNWLVFFIMNVGILFLAMWPAALAMRGEKRGLFLGALAIFVLSNVVAFQPNLYDNNKLLYIWFMITDILVCDVIWDVLETAPRRGMRAAIAGVIVFLGTFSGILSLMRETVSEYRLLSEEQVAAADYILAETEPDSLFLTATSHTNPVSVLTGRNIVCGSSLYLYFHGVNYQEREAALPAMFAGGEEFERCAAELGIDYVYLGENEYANYNVNYDYFHENYPLVYDSGGISIFRIG
ncbi:MAG: hypothetical protein ACI3W7_00650 [Oscillospiraceae bacterium]